jgi:hypothetical protein
MAVAVLILSFLLYNTKLYAYRDMITTTKAATKPQIGLLGQRNISIGAWAPSQFHLEDLDASRQIMGIRSLLAQGFDEYYFVMRDFTNITELEATEKLLKSADKTTLKIIIIILPQSEGGMHANYDWKGWIEYLNSLKERHPSSFLGFTIDDFNAITGIRRLYVMNNLYFMSLSNLSYALNYKRQDVQFYPVMYLETSGFETVKTKYNKFLAGIILVNTLSNKNDNNNKTSLGKQIAALSKMFEDKLLKYIVYADSSSQYNNSNNNTSSSDRLLMTQLYTVSRLFNGIIIYINTDNSIVQKFLHTIHDLPKY